MYRKTVEIPGAKAAGKKVMESEGQREMACLCSKQTVSILYAYGKVADMGCVVQARCQWEHWFMKYSIGLDSRAGRIL